MLLDPQKIPTREKLILTGLYLAKYDSAGLRKLGFGGFVEAFNVIGYALGQKPASIKNYRDEFDPHFPNRRKGWHNRPTRAYCLKVFNEYKDLDVEEFTGLVKSFVGYDENAWSEVETKEKKDDSGVLFARRVITGLAAEHYFEQVHPKLTEVKGLAERKGNVSLTPKEHEVAEALTDRFFLFVVKNFSESPFHEIYQNPLSGSLRFAKKERVVMQVSWLANV